MKYLRCSLSDKTPIKFKIERVYSYGLFINWKYTYKLNSSKYINLNVSEFMMDMKVELLQQLTDDELINKYKDLIEEEHARIKKINRKI